MSELTELKGHHDALVVGVGFGGLYSLYLLKQKGFRVVAVDSGSDVGGTWHFNRYPGARSDVNTHAYQLSFDKGIWNDFLGPNNYFLQNELETLFRRITKKHELYPLIHFKTELKEAHWDDEKNVWQIKTNTGKQFTVRYLLTALGILHRPYVPDFPGLKNFKGKVVHTAAWDPDVEYKGKRIGVIGSGASGVQVFSALAETAGDLTHFIRHAQYVLPAQYRPRGTEEKKDLDEQYRQIWSGVFDSQVGFGFDEPQRKVFDVSEEEREKIFQELWDLGSGFRFLFGGFSDIATNKASNQAAIDFIHKKIDDTVKDPQKAEVLKSKDWFARRPLTDDNYYARFNQENVHAVDLQKTPIAEFVAEGIKTEDGKVHELDLLVAATGFDSVDGSYDAVDFKGRKGVDLKDHWKGHPVTYLGTMTAEFPNMFFINGPGVPFANNPPVCEAGGNFVAELIDHAEKNGSGVIEADTKAAEEWTEMCGKVAGQTLFAETPSWFFAENIPGKTAFPRFWFGGIAKWREAINKSRDEGWSGFHASA